MKRVETILNWLSGVSVSLGLLVVLDQFAVPYYLYYPQTTNTVILSIAVDKFLFVAASMSVPVEAFLRLGRCPREMVRSFLYAVSISLWLIGLALATYSSQFILVLFASVVIVFLQEFRAQPDRKVRISYGMLGLLTVPTLLESSSIPFWISSSVNPYSTFGSSTVLLETGFTYSLFIVAPLLLAVLLLSWVWIPGLSLACKFPRIVVDGPIGSLGSGFDRRITIASLDLFGIISILLTSFLYLAGQAWIVGADSLIDYFNPLQTIKMLPTGDALAMSLKLFHGIYVGILYVLSLTGLDQFTVVKYAPLVLAFATSSLLFLAFRGGFGYRSAVLSGLCALFWLPTTLGTWAGIQSNWFAFMLWILFLVVMLRRKWGSVSLLTESFLSLGILLVHPWTWGIFLASIIFMGFFSLKTSWKRETMGALLSSVSLAVPVGAFAYFFTSLRSDLAYAFSLYVGSLTLKSLLEFPGALLEMVHTWSPFLSPALLILSILGAYSMTRRGGMAEMYLVAWIATWCVGSLLVAPLGYHPSTPDQSETQLWRLLYLSPLPVLLALGIEKCVTVMGRLSRNGLEAISRKEMILIPTAMLMFGVVLFLSDNPLIRAGTVLTVLAIAFLITVRYPVDHVVRILTATLLLLIVVNAALRSLYPLLIDPHNLLGTFQGGFS